jgi:hypothetical protein
MKKPDRLFSKSIGLGARRTKGRSHKVLPDARGTEGRYATSRGTPRSDGLE